MKGQAEVRRGRLSPLVLRGAVHVVAGLGPDGNWWDVQAAPLDATIDTGASRSCVPRSLCDGTRGPVLLPSDFGTPTDWQEVRPQRSLPIYSLYVHVLGRGPFPILAYSRDAPGFLLGRDLLARFLLALDGPAGAYCLRGTSALDRFARRLLRCP